MGTPSGTFQRPDIGMHFESLDVAATRRGFIGLNFLTPMPVGLQTASFSKIKAEDLMERRDTLRAPGAAYNRQEWQFIQDSYTTKEYGAEEVVDRRERAIYQYTGIDMDMVTAERARDAVLREQEIRIANLLFSTTNTDNESNTQGNADASGNWSDADASNPVDDIANAVLAFEDQFGDVPNTIVMNDVNAMYFKRSAQTREDIKYWGGEDPKSMGPSALIGYFKEFGIDRVLVGSGRYNSAKSGQDASFTSIWSSSYVWVGRTARTQDLREPCIGRTMVFTADGASEGGTVEQYPWEPNRSDVVRVRIDTHEKMIYAKAGYLITVAGL